MDTVTEQGGNDRIVFGEGISADNIRIVQSSNNLVVTILDDEGKQTFEAITLQDARTRESSQIETLEFSDGSTRSLSAMLEAQDRIYGTYGKERLYGSVQDDWLIASGGNDTVYAGEGDDVLDAGAGNDSLYGGAGADSYHFSWTSGNKHHL